MKWFWVAFCVFCVVLVAAAASGVQAGDVAVTKVERVTEYATITKTRTVIERGGYGSLGTSRKVERVKTSGGSAGKVETKAVTRTKVKRKH